jgi:glycosyltransferase involved in cell wall biosynthesis
MMPHISVIIPVYNDPNGLRDTIQSLIVQTYQKNNYEIIIADNGSTDNTINIAKAYQKKFPELIKIAIENGIQSSYAARNKGILISQGQFLVFVDADMTVMTTWLNDVYATINTGSISYLACNVSIILKNKTLCGEYNQLTGFPISRLVSVAHFAPTCCLIINRNILNKVEYFDENLISGGDLEFGNRVYDKGCTLHFAEHLNIFHPARSTLKSLSKKNFRVGRGFYQLGHKYPERFPQHVKNLFNPIHVLPIRPHLLIKRASKSLWIRSSLFKKISFYILACIEKCIVHAGYCYETIISKSTKTGL